MIVAVAAHVVPPPASEWQHMGYGLPTFTLDNTIGPAFTDFQQAARIAADVALYGRPVGTRVHLGLSTFDDTAALSFVVASGGLIRPLIKVPADA